MLSSSKRSMRASCLYVALSMLLAVSSILSCSASSPEARRTQSIDCALSAANCVSTWLYANADSEEDANTIREDALGEKRLINAGDRWQPIASKDPLLRLPTGRGFTFAYVELVAETNAARDLQLGYTGDVRLWVNSTLLLEKQQTLSRTISRAKAKVPMEQGMTYAVLLELRETTRPAVFLTVTDRKKVQSTGRTLHARLPSISAKQIAQLTLNTFDLSTGTKGMLPAQGPAEIRLGPMSGYPILSQPVSATLTITDPSGVVRNKQQLGPLPITEIATTPFSLFWTPPDDSIPLYNVAAELSAGELIIGTLESRLYSESGVHKWADQLEEDVHQISSSLGASTWLDSSLGALIALKIEKAQIHLQSRQLPAKAIPSAATELIDCSQALACLSGEKQWTDDPGLIEKAYFSDIDESPQPYFVYLPKSFSSTSAAPYPLIVYLHGYTPWLDKTNWYHFGPEMKNFADRHGFILLMPFARSNTDFQSIGELDVLHTLDLIKKSYPIDEDRVLLFGYSMGGMGAYTVASHYPHLWAGVTAVSARGDYYMWHGLDPEKIPPFKRWLIDLEFGYGLADNLANVPVSIFQGKKDSVIEAEQAPHMAARYRDLGVEVELTEYEDEDHWIGSRVFFDHSFDAWATARKRDLYPKTISYVTYSTRYSRAYWVEIKGIQQWGVPATISAKVRDGNRVVIDAKNVLSLEIDAASELFGDAESLIVMLNGQEQEISIPQDRKIRLSVAQTTLDTLSIKSRHTMGPIKEAYNSRFILVRGTSGTFETQRQIRANVREAASEWDDFAKGKPIIKDDIQITQQDVLDANLILFGTPRSNHYLAKIADQLPIAFRDDQFVIGEHTFPSRGLGLAFIYPNPDNPNRYVVIRSGVPYGRSLSENHKYDLMPDFIVYDADNDPDGTNRYLCAGFFDSTWHISPDLTWLRQKAEHPQ